MEIRYRDIFFLIDSLLDIYFHSKAFRKKQTHTYIHTRFGIHDNRYDIFSSTLLIIMTQHFLTAFMWRLYNRKRLLLALYEGEKVFEYKRKLGTVSCISRPLLSPRVLLHRLVSASRVPSRFRYNCRRCAYVCAADAYICIYAHTIPRTVGGMQISQRET